MALTAYDIHNKEFKRSFRGYDVDEVNDFLDQIIKEFEILTREKLELEQQVEELQAEIDRLLQGDSSMYTGQQTAMQPSNQGTQRFSAVTPETAPLHSPMQNQNNQQYTGMQPAVPATNAPAPISQMSLSSMEQSIHKSIRVAQEVAEEVRINAKKEAELIVQEAEKNADRIINEALQKARAIHSELLDLKQKATVYRARFRTLVQSHLDILENSDWESLEELETNLEERGKQLEQFAERSHTNNEQYLLESPQHQLVDHQQGNMNMMDYQQNQYQSHNQFQNNYQNQYQNQFQQQSHMQQQNMQMPSNDFRSNNDFRNNDFKNNEFKNNEYRTVDESQSVIDEVAASYMEEEEEPRRELRRTARKLKKKAMF